MIPADKSCDSADLLGEMDDFAAPVKGIVKALDTGVKLAKRVSRSAGSAPAAKALQISESAHNLQKVLEESSKAISDAYMQYVGSCGEPFTTALVDESKLSWYLVSYTIANLLAEPVQSKLKEFRIDLIDQINECDFDEDEPKSFNPTAFANVQTQAQKSCTQCIAIFNDLRDRLLLTNLQNFQLEEKPKDDRADLSSMRGTSASRKPISGQPPPVSTSPPHDRPVLTLETPPSEPLKPRSPWSIDGPSQFDMGPVTTSGAILHSIPVPQAPYRGHSVLVVSPPASDYGSDISHLKRHNEPPYPTPPQSQGRPLSDVSPLTATSEQAPPLIRKEIVYSRLNQNEEFLERRRQSRLLFQTEMRKSISSISSIEENRTSQNFSDGSMFNSPRLGHSTMLSSSGASGERSPITLKQSGSRNGRPNSASDKSGPWREKLISPNEKSSSYNERNRISEGFSDGISPILEYSISPIDGRTSRSSANGYDTLMTRQRSQGQASQTTRSSRTSSILQEVRQQDRPKLDRKDSHASQASQESIFGLRNAEPLSPPLSEHRTSGSGNWGTLATTLQVPGFGEGVESGLEVVDTVDRDNGLILATEGEVPVQQTPTTSMKSVDYPMRHDSSFYKFGGFCDGAKNMIRGETAFRVMKRPSVRTSHSSKNTATNTFQGHYSATVSARCMKCSYEVGWNDVEKDRLLERSGIYGNSGIRFRQKFISKCHLRTNNVDEPVYACIFCIEEHRTVEEHDATVFFSVTKLFQHLAKHSRPLPNIAGVAILYGFQPPHVLDFDIHFTTPEPKFQQFSMMEIAPKAATRPAAHATTTHHPKNNRSSSRDPEGNPTLHFAAGARIVGITFPDRFHGQWCIGYHDGERGSFPANTIMLEMPVREDVLMNAQSNLVAFAKWDFKLKDAKEGGWLKFSKGDKISSVGYTFQDQWCWSGQIGTGSKSKFGLFPAAFVEGLREDVGGGVGNGKLGSSPGIVKIGSGLGLGSLGSRIGSGLGRNKSSRGHERSASVRSSGSTSSGGMVAVQPGLEVVQSPIHSNGGSWRS